MKSLRVLITNNTLDVRAGSELYVRDLAIALLKRGHQPVAYSPRLGEVASELRAKSIPVIDNLDQLNLQPDIIHGQHHLETMTALLRFPQAPALHYCHGWLPWEETPLRHPRIYRYIAVDEVCRERLLFEGGIAPEHIVVLLNFVDLARFLPREPLPAKPKRALFFSNYVRESPQLLAVRTACEAAGISLDVMGIAAGTANEKPENELGKYDLVFTKARSALEALAVGNAVILCDVLHSEGLGGMVTMAELHRWRPLNFGIRTITQLLTASNVLQEINRYDAHDATRVTAHIRATASLEITVDALLALYQDIIAEHTTTTQLQREEKSRAEAAYLRWLSSRFGEWNKLAIAAHEANVELMQARNQIAHLQPATELLLAQKEELKNERDVAVNERDQLRSQWEAWQRSRTGRLLRLLYRIKRL